MLIDIRPPPSINPGRLVGGTHRLPTRSSICSLCPHTAAVGSSLSSLATTPVLCHVMLILSRIVVQLQRIRADLLMLAPLLDLFLHCSAAPHHYTSLYSLMMRPIIILSWLLLRLQSFFSNLLSSFSHSVLSHTCSTHVLVDVVIVFPCLVNILPQSCCLSQHFFFVNFLSVTLFMQRLWRSFCKLEVSFFFSCNSSYCDFSCDFL